MATIRLMRPEDADAVRALDVRAFTLHVRRFVGAEEIPPRRRENVLASLALNPGGCFVAEDGGQLAGFVFSRRWGAYGWIGVFGVDPVQQGHGVGQALLARTVAGLEGAGCAVIGLETMPDCAYNVGFYMRAGFRPALSTVVVERSPAPAAPSPAYARLSQVDVPAGLAAVTAVSQAALPGLDCAAEAQNALQFGWGETLLVGWPEPWACAIVRLSPQREGPADATAVVANLTVASAARERWPEAACAAEALARERSIQSVRFSVNAANWPTLQGFMAAGWRVSHLALRLLRKGDYQPAGVELSRWAM